jgi:hypothetical protein
VLKIDIEGTEYDVLEQMIEEKFFPFTQLLVEYHVRMTEAFAKRHERVIKGLQENGFALIGTTHKREEAAYIKLDDLPYCFGGPDHRAHATFEI